MSLPLATQQGLLVLQVRSILEFAVRTKIFVHFTDLAGALKIHVGGVSLPNALFAIMEEDKRAGRALTCALVVTSIGLPHKGFFDRAKDLGFQFPEEQRTGESQERQFWESQVRQLRGDSDETS